MSPDMAKLEDSSPLNWFYKKNVKETCLSWKKRALVSYRNTWKNKSYWNGKYIVKVADQSLRR